MIDYVASSFLGLPFVEVADDDSQAIRAARTVPGNITQPLTKFSKARARFPVLWSNPHKVIATHLWDLMSDHCVLIQRRRTTGPPALTCVLTSVLTK